MPCKRASGTDNNHTKRRRDTTASRKPAAVAAAQHHSKLLFALSKHQFEWPCPLAITPSTVFSPRYFLIDVFAILYSSLSSNSCDIGIPRGTAAATLLGDLSPVVPFVVTNDTTIALPALLLPLARLLCFLRERWPNATLALVCAVVRTDGKGAARTPFGARTALRRFLQYVKTRTNASFVVASMPYDGMRGLADKLACAAHV